MQKHISFFLSRKDTALKSVKVESFALMHIAEQSVDSVLAFIRQHQICQKCRSSVNETGHDLVGRYCLQCVLEAHPELSYLGYDHTDTDNRPVYRFRSDNGSIFTSTQGLTEAPSEDVALALRETGFTLPETFKPFKATQEEKLFDHYWKYYGNITNSVLVLEYHDKYSHGGVYAVFLVYKDGETVEFSKRTTLYKNLMDKATKAAERTKRHGEYHINGTNNIVRLTDETLYPIVSALESAVYDVQLQMVAPPLIEIDPFFDTNELPIREQPDDQPFLSAQFQEQEPTEEQPTLTEGAGDIDVDINAEQSTEEPVSLDTQRRKRTRKNEEATDAVAPTE